MTRYVALLRAINVGGTGKLPMADLRATLGDLGYDDVVTLLASGNAVFDAKGKAMKIEADIETALRDQHGLGTDVMVRNLTDWSSLIDDNPLKTEAADAPAKTAIMAFKSPPDLSILDTYLATYAGPEIVRPGERCLYLHYTDGMGQSKLKIPAKVGAGTVRNWNTVLKIKSALSA